MEKENQEKMDKKEKKELKMKAKQEKKEAKIKAKQDKKLAKSKKEKKKLDKYTVFRKLLAAFLIAFTILGTCYTCIYLIING